MADPATAPPADAHLDTLEQEAEAFRREFAAVRTELAKVMVGQKEIINGVLLGLFVGGNVLLEGPPGLGKTLLIRTLAGALSLEFSRVQFTPDLMPADITGTTIVAEEKRADGTTDRVFRFQPGPIFAQIVLADEINRATPKTQAAMLEAMQEKSVTIGGTTHAMPRPFFVMATQNPIEQEGTYPLPEAQLDRFLFKLLVPPTGREDLHEILNRTTAGVSAEPKAVMDGERIRHFQRLVRQVLIAPPVQDYAVRAVLATHPDSSFAPDQVRGFVRFGASPRAAQTLVLAGKAVALLSGRVHVSIEDLQSVLLPTLRHRIGLNFEAQAQGVEADTLVRHLREQLSTESPA